MISVYRHFITPKASLKMKMIVHFIVPLKFYLMIFRITKMTETGLLEHWIQKWTPQNLNCTGLKAVTRSKVVTMSDFQGALYILLFGGGAAMLILLTEQIYNFCSKWRKRKRKFDLEHGIFHVADGLRGRMVQSWS